MLTALVILAVLASVGLVAAVRARRRTPNLERGAQRGRVAAAGRAVVARATAALADLAGAPDRHGHVAPRHPGVASTAAR